MKKIQGKKKRLSNPLTTTVLFYCPEKGNGGGTESNSRPPIVISGTRKAANFGDPNTPVAHGRMSIMIEAVWFGGGVVHSWRIYDLAV